MDTVFLIVRGDDFGLCHAANQAIWEGLEAGALTCASLAVAGPWVGEAAALIHSHPEWEIGLQLVLHCDTVGCRWGPVAGPAAVPSLVEPTGMFPERPAPGAVAADITAELDAQVDRARAWGITPCYLEYPAEATPAVAAALEKLSQRLGIPARMVDWGLASVLGAEGAGLLDPLEALAKLAPGFHLWVVRPARDTPETWALWPAEHQPRRHHADAVAVCDPDVLSLIRGRGIELIGFRELVENRVGSEAEKE